MTNPLDAIENDVLGFSAAVLIAAKEIVNKPPTSIGYSDVGDVIVAHLRGEKNVEEALESLRLLDEDYERKRRPRPTLPVMIFMGKNATSAKVYQALDVQARLHGWSRHIRLVLTDRELSELRGYRGPEVWWIDWGATQEMRNHAAVYEFKRATVEECNAAIQAFIGDAR